MSIIRVPEIILLNRLQKALFFLREDYNSKSNKNETYLFNLLSTLGYERYQFFEQAERVFITADEKDSRFLEVDLMYNMNREKIPAIHITMPSESPGQNSLGNDQGYLAEFISPNEESYQDIFTRRYKATYDIVIMSDNSNECLLIYHIMKSLLVALSVQFHLEGLENLTFSGQDLQPYIDLVPKNIFVRAIRLGLEYESSALTFENYPLARDIIFSGKAVEEL